MDRPNNTLLRVLPAEDFQRLQPHLRAEDLKLGDVLYGPEDRVERVTFVETGLLSVVFSSLGGQSVETSMIGREGASGLVEACGSGHSFITILVQVEGRGFSAPAAAIRDLHDRSAAFRDLLARYAEAMLAEARQSVVCQALHLVESRCARWLIESAERSGCDSRLPLTQEYLASMLGVQRTTVTPIAAMLQRRGLIRYSRGRIDILDSEGLDRAACECRSNLKAHRRRLGLDAT